MIELIGIARKRQKRGEVELLESAAITERDGIVGDHRGRGGSDRDRQITVLAYEQWEMACAQVRVGLFWTARRANLLINGGTCFGPQHIGKRLRLGGSDGAILEITGKTDACKRMDEMWPGLKVALTPDWRGGVACRVIRAGLILVSDKVEIF